MWAALLLVAGAFFFSYDGEDRGPQGAPPLGAAAGCGGEGRASELDAAACWSGWGAGRAFLGIQPARPVLKRSATFDWPGMSPLSKRARFCLPAPASLKVHGSASVSMWRIPTLPHVVQNHIFISR